MTVTVTETAQALYDELGPWRNDLSLILCGALCDSWDPIVQLISDTDAGPGWSAALDVDRCPPWLLPWLGQWVGVKVPAGADAATMRSVITDEAGFARGTVAAIMQATVPYFLPGYAPVLLERTPDPYTITVQFTTSELNTLTYAQLAAAYPTYPDVAAAFATYDEFGDVPGQMEAAVRAAVPAGINVVFEQVDAPDVIDGGVAPSPAVDFYDGGVAPAAPADTLIDGGTL